MKKKTMYSKITFIAVSFSLLAVTAFAVNPCYANKVKDTRSANNVEMDIALSDAQRELLLDAEASYRESIIELEAEQEILFIKEDRLLADAKINFQSLRELVRARTKIVTQIELLDIDALEKIKATVSDQQWRQYVRHNESLNEGWFDEFDENRCDSIRVESEEMYEMLLDEAELTPFSFLVN